MSVMPAHTHRSAGARSARPAAVRLPRPGVPRGTAAALAVLGPIAGAALGRALGSYDGLVFGLCCLLGALAGALVATPAGLWWAVPGVPLAIWAVGVAAELAWHTPPYRTGRDQAVGVAHAMVHVFPVMGIAVIGMVTVIALRRAGALRGRWARG